MPKNSKGPWFWKARKQWIVNIRGVRHYLGTEYDTAYQEFLRLSKEEPRVTGAELNLLFDQFLSWCKKYRPDSHGWYEDRLVSFWKSCRPLKVSELKPHHVQKWIDTKKSDGHRRGCIIAVNRALNWGVKQGHIKENPIRFMEKPTAGRREAFLTPKEFETLLSHCSDELFKDLLNFCWETGCRPQEAFRLEARHVDGARCIFPEKESKGKKKKRVIWFTPAAAGIVNRLVSSYPEGRLFRNEDGNPWRRNNLACRFARMKSKVGKKYSLYHLRHSYCQRALKNGVDPITLAELMGHASAAMIMKIYQHLGQDGEHMAAAAMKAAK